MRIHELRRLPAVVLAAALVAIPSPGGTRAATRGASEVRVITLPRNGSPLVHVRALIGSGSADDPPGREGLAAFTAAWMRRGAGDEALKEISGSLDVTAGKDAIIVSGTVPPKNFAAWASIFEAMLVSPPFDPGRLEEVRAGQKRALETALDDDAFLAREMLDVLLYPAHPYAHPALGRLGAIDTFTRDEAVAFHREHSRQGNILVGLAGPVTDDMAASMRTALERLPGGAPSRPPRTLTRLPRPRMILVEKKTSGPIRIALGHPLVVTEAHADYFPFLVAAASLEVVRGPFPRAVNTPPDDSRRDPSFTISAAPAPVNAKFVLKQSFADIGEVAASGIPAARLDTVRSALREKHAAGMAEEETALRWSLDAVQAGSPGIDGRFAASLDAVTTGGVSGAARRHLQTSYLGIVAVVEDAGAFIDRMLSAETLIEYPPDVNRESTRSRDLEIVGMKAVLERGDFRIVKAAGIFR